MGVELVISGVRRCRIACDVPRHLLEGIDDLAMPAACGLHSSRAPPIEEGSGPLIDPNELNARCSSHIVFILNPHKAPVHTLNRGYLCGTGQCHWTRLGLAGHG